VSAPSISHYQILQKLGAGGMGEVYKAYDTTLERPVALKILPAGLVEHEDRVRRFVQEAKAASSLNHPHIITIHEIGEVRPEDGGKLQAASEFNVSEAGTKPSPSPAAMGAGVIHYIAMEFIEGETLSAKIHHNRVSLRKLLEYLLQVSEGLTKAHQSGIVHRDLKPDNVMITADGYAKILDFGLAKLLEPQRPISADSTEAATALMGETQPGVVMGTVGYMSPEQAQGKSVDHRSDIFSFGCMLYEAVTRHKPFQGDSAIDSLHKIIYTEPQPVRQFNPACPYELQRIIRRCLAKDPEDRWQRMKDVALDLREMLEEYRTEGSMMGSPANAHVGEAAGVGPAFALEAGAADLDLDEDDPRVQRFAGFSKASVALAILGILGALIFWPANKRGAIGSELRLDYAGEAAQAKAREVATGLG
jgi:serine/threonine protein kinase